MFVTDTTHGRTSYFSLNVQRLGHDFDALTNNNGSLFPVTDGPFPLSKFFSFQISSISSNIQRQGNPASQPQLLAKTIKRYQSCPFGFAEVYQDTTLVFQGLEPFSATKILRILLLLLHQVRDYLRLEWTTYSVSRTCARLNRTTTPLGVPRFEALTHHQAGSCTQKNVEFLENS